MNFDATQIHLSSDSKCGVRVVTTVEGRKRPRKTSAPVNCSALPNAVKYFSVVSSGGLVCPYHIFILADPALSATSFFQYCVENISISGSAGEHIYLCFVQRRAGNPAMFEFFVRDCVMKWLKDLREQGVIDPKKKCALIFDGEDQQLKAFRNPDIYNNLTFDSLLCVKLPGSCSACTQPLDAGMIFHNTKQAISDASVAADDNVIGSVVRRIIDKHEAKVGHRVKGASQIVTGLPIVIRALKKNLSSQGALHSFASVGLQNNTLNCQQILQRFGVHVDESVVAEFEEEVRQLDLTTKFLRDGQVTDADMMGLSIVRNKATRRDRSTYAECQQRCVIINNPLAVQRRIDAEAKKSRRRQTV